MKAQSPSKSLGEGRDVAPSLAHPSQKQNLVVYTKELTHLGRGQEFESPRAYHFFQPFGAVVHLSSPGSYPLFNPF